ncbi:unnamed protein product [Phytophthora lilii]|uniref:Unnamed protein product n=1 Tax=Phytophthora lilii TaxID=2077276 RepID=A0A9W6WRP0_9STRA|nr:unnamed protein product [Phytophthora lilii]
MQRHKKLVLTFAAVTSKQVMIRQLQDTLGRFVGALGNVGSEASWALVCFVRLMSAAVLAGADDRDGGVAVHGGAVSGAAEVLRLHQRAALDRGD